MRRFDIWLRRAKGSNHLSTKKIPCCACTGDFCLSSSPKEDHANIVSVILLFFTPQPPKWGAQITAIHMLSKSFTGSVAGFSLGLLSKTDHEIILLFFTPKPPKGGLKSLHKLNFYTTGAAGLFFVNTPKKGSP